MKKLSINSLTIGIGLGIIISSIINIIWVESRSLDYNDKVAETQKFYGESLNFNNNISKLASLKTSNNNNHIKLDKNNISDIDNEIYIPRGFNSEQIANLLEKEGIIESSEEFNELATNLVITRKFQHGLKTIPTHSTLNEIMLILTEK